MNEQDKKLLLKDLCARLPYGVKIHYHYSNKLGTIKDEDREIDFSDVETLKYTNEYPQDDWCEISLKPYLRQLSSMTDEEIKELDDIEPSAIVYGFSSEIIRFVDDTNGLGIGLVQTVRVIDWLNEHHFDYRNLIEKGLAIEATDNMYE